MISLAERQLQARKATAAGRPSRARPAPSPTRQPRPARARARKVYNFDHLGGLDTGMGPPVEIPSVASPKIQRQWERAFAVALGNGRVPAPRANSAIQRDWDRAFAKALGR